MTRSESEETDTAAMLARFENRLSRIEAENETLRAEMESQQSSKLTRRGALGTLLGGGLLMGAASQPASAATKYWDDTDSDDQVELQVAGTDYNNEEVISLRGINRDIQFVNAGRSIQDAVNAAGDSGIVFIEPNYDTANEPNWPVVVNKELIIKSATRAVIDRPDSATTDTFEIDHGGANEYPGARFVNVTVNGGGRAFNVADARFVHFYGCLAENTSSGFVLGESGTTQPIGCRLAYCDADDSDANGFTITNGAHDTQLVGCIAEESGQRGIEVLDRTTNVGIFGGTVQYNSEEGIYANDVRNLGVRNVYVEGNNGGSGQAIPSQLHMVNCFNPILESIYINGGGSGTAQLGMEIDTCDRSQVRGFYTRNLADGLIRLEGSAGNDNDIYRDSHTSQDGNPIVSEDRATRTRSRGIITTRNLSGETGQFVGDRGIDDGSNTGVGPMLCLWTGSAWQPSDGSGSFS